MRVLDTAHILLSISGICVSIALYFLAQKYIKITNDIENNLFHFSNFTAAHNLMAAFGRRKISQFPEELRTAYISFISATQGAEAVDSVEVNKINNESDYLNRVNPALASGSSEIAALTLMNRYTQEKYRIEKLQNLCTVILLISQILQVAF